jgi:fructose/tagatose bisphosphate aldolase
VSNGVVKMNIDTDTQWAYWDGIRQFYKKNEGYLQGQVPFWIISYNLADSTNIFFESMLANVSFAYLNNRIFFLCSIKK